MRCSFTKVIVDGDCNNKTNNYRQGKDDKKHDVPQFKLYGSFKSNLKSVMYHKKSEYLFDNYSTYCSLLVTILITPYPTPRLVPASEVCKNFYIPP